MLEFTAHADESSLALVGALLMYGETQKGGAYQVGRAAPAPCVVTVHQVKDINGRPEILPGRLLQEVDLVEVMKGVTSARRALEIEWQDASILARGPDRLIWWSPPGKRAMFFEKSSYNAQTFTGRGNCPVPGLVWMARPGHGLFVYACRGTARPTRDTPLFQAPLFNVWGSGQVCTGNTPLPDERQQGDTRAWENVVFGSRFTHPNFTQKDRLVKGIAPTTFWKQMVSAPAKTFPESRLVKLPITVGDLLEIDILEKLRSWPSPEGEF